MRQLFLLPMFVLLAGCQRVPDSTTRFCIQGVDDGVIGRALTNDYIDIDLRNRRLHASDTSDQIELVNRERFFGMASPLPLLVLRSNVHAITPQFSHGKHLFHIAEDDSGSKTYRANVYSRGDDGRLRRVLTYRYTMRDGIQEIRAETALSISSSPQIMKKCGGEPLFGQPGSG